MATGGPVGSLAELVEQGGLLLLAEALDPTVVGDADLVHDLAGLDLAHAGQGLEQRDDLELADGVLGGGERLCQRERADLQLVLDLGTSGTGFGGWFYGRPAPVLEEQGSA